jgi:hypothetical protein
VGFFMILALVGCGDDTPPDTGLTGLVLRGPTQPVCQAEVPCDAPFAARFAVLRDGRQVREFASDAEGHFTVPLAPGSYRVVPGPDAPLLAPTSQYQDVVVRDTGLTADTLLFDTGIR